MPTSNQAIDPNSIIWDSGPPPQATSGPIDANDVIWDGPAVDQTDPHANGFTPDEQKQILAYIPKAKDAADLDAYGRKISGGRVGISNAQAILDDYSNTHRKGGYAFVNNPEGDDEAPPQSATPLEWFEGLANSAGRGFVNTLGFIDDAVNPFEHLPRNPFRTPTKEELEAEAGPGFFQRGIDSAFTSVFGDPKPKNVLQKYANAAAYGVGGAAVPIGGSVSSVRGATAAVFGGAGAGVGSQAGADLFPNSPVAPLIGGIIGGHVAGTPLALKPIRDTVYVNKNADHPEAPYVAQAAQDLAAKAADVAPAGLTPKGRGKLTVAQINAVAKKGLLGMPDDINRLVQAGELDPQLGHDLKLAIQNRDGITVAEINKLRGTTEGDAVAEALMHYRATQSLTKPFGGDQRGPLAKVWNGAVKVAPIPKLIADHISIKPGDVNAARIRGADKAIDNVQRYKDLQRKTGPTQVGPALEAFQGKVADTISNQQAAAEMAQRAQIRQKAAKAQLSEQAGNTPTGRKLSPADQAVSEQIDQGIKGSGNALNAYAGILNVKPEDVTRALDQIDVPEAFKFEATKLRNGYNVNRTAQQVLIPRLKAALEKDGTIAARASEPKAPAEPKPAAEPAKSSSEPAPAAPEAQAAPEEDLNYKYIRRPAAHAQGKAQYQAAFDRTVNDHAMLHDGQLMSDAAPGIAYMRDRTKTTEAAMDYFDQFVGPKLRAKGHTPEEIDQLRTALEEASTVGKPYKTQAELEKKAMTRGPGRPKKDESSDDVPF